MSFDWKLFVDLSNELLSYQRTGSLKEAYFRTTVSRAYYGVYGVAANYLLSQGITLPHRNQHQFVSQYYNSSNVRLERKIGADLNRLWRRRKHADYKADSRVDESAAQMSLRFANRSISNLQSIGAM